MDNLSKLRGQIERITFVNEESGFTIAKIRIQGEKELVTIVGSLPGINPGEVLELLGEWGNHPKFGTQFKIVKFKSVVPATVAGIEKYLGFGLIKGIGPIMASRLASQESSAQILSPLRQEKKRIPKKETLRSKPGPDHPWRKPWKKKLPWEKKPLTDIFTEHLTWHFHWTTTQVPDSKSQILLFKQSQYVPLTAT